MSETRDVLAERAAEIRGRLTEALGIGSGDDLDVVGLQVVVSDLAGVVAEVARRVDELAAHVAAVGRRLDALEGSVTTTVVRVREGKP